MAENNTQEDFNDSEIIIGLVGPIGVDFAQITDLLSSKFKAYRYEVESIRVSEVIIPQFVTVKPHGTEYERIANRMDAGDQARAITSDNSILARGVAAFVASRRNPREQLRPRVAYIVHSLKHPDEVYRLQRIYPHGFYLIGVSSSEERRKRYLMDRKGMSEPEARLLIDRDHGDATKSGQHTSDTFHLADFFVNLDDEENNITGSVDRILKLLFGSPFITPLFDEFAMFMAFTASLRSADLSRQVGAVIALDDEILAVGANDCPKFGGGLYWPKQDPDGKVVDTPKGRDCTRGIDANKDQQSKLIQQICDEAVKAIPGTDVEKLRSVLARSPITDLIEFGRVVHAEMEAMLSCGRRGVSTVGATVFCTTFPCHNCAKHIIAAGMKRVVYVEPYPKSKAFELHDEAVTVTSKQEKAVLFEPFVGVSPRRFFDLFSMNLSFGWNLKRKDKNSGRAVAWSPENAKLRVQMLPLSYLRLESLAALDVAEAQERIAKDNDHG